MINHIILCKGGGNNPAVAVPLVALGTQSRTIDVIDVLWEGGQIFGSVILCCKISNNKLNSCKISLRVKTKITCIRIKLLWKMENIYWEDKCWKFLGNELADLIVEAI